MQMLGELARNLRTAEKKMMKQIPKMEFPRYSGSGLPQKTNGKFSDDDS
jgi:hypothetical protein